jgi:hypothetical protein
MMQTAMISALAGLALLASRLGLSSGLWPVLRAALGSISA